jgi:RNA polymerase sigma-70 factor, ECF subfamily
MGTFELGAAGENLFLRRKIDAGEFEEAAVPHLNELYQTAVHLVRDRTEAQDVVQNVYFNAWKSFHRFEPGTNCRAWLFKILFNEIRHYRRKWFTNRIIPNDERSLEETVAYEPPIAKEIKDEDVLAALDEIPGEFREVVLLADVHEFAYKEIAQTLNVPVGTVMSRLSRGRKHLRSKLADYAKDHGIPEGKQEVQGDQMRHAEGNDALGPEFIGLVPLVTEKLGPNFDMVQGHRCVANGRRYVHLILTGNKGTILSLVITQKNGETFGRAEIAAALHASGIAVYSANEGQLEVAGFETNRYLVFVVSDLDHDGNLKVAADLVPPVYEFLRRLEA